MSNWFENNQTKSVIGYTLVIAGATWATSTFVLQDNRLNLAKSELESQKSLTEQYKSKTELLQRDIDALRTENAEYRAWLGQTKDAIPAIVPRIVELKSKVAVLENEAQQLRVQHPSTQTIAVEQSATLGKAYIDDETGLIVTVKKTMPDRTAQLMVRFPDKEAVIEATISPGQQWKFNAKGRSYQLTITEISWWADSVRFRIGIS